MMELVTVGSVRHAKVYSNLHRQQTATQLSTFLSLNQQYQSTVG